MADKPATVKVEALQVHSYNGGEYQIGDTYDIAEDLVDSVTAQGKAVRVAQASTQRTAKSAKAPKTAKAKARSKK